MNKSILFMAGLIGLALTACDDKSDLGTMQVNEQPGIIAANGVAIESRFISNGVNQINLDNYQSVNVPLFDIAISNEFPETATVTGILQVASQPDFSDAVEMALTATSEVPVKDTNIGEGISGGSRKLVGEVFGNDWEDAFVDFYGNAPYPRTNYLRFKLYTTDGTQQTIIYSDNNGTQWWPAMEFEVTPVDMRLDVASAYNFVWSSAGQSGTLPMYHDPEKHQYDDPEFVVSFEVSEEQAAAGFSFNIVSGDDPSKVYGVANGFEADASTARLAEGSSVKAVVAQPGSYRLTADMLTKIYTIGVAPKTLYVMGQGQVFANNVAQLPTTDFVNYEGTAGLIGVWCLTGQASYRPTVFFVDSFSKDAETGVMSGKLRLSTDGTILSPSTGAELPSGKVGLSYFKVNTQALTFEATPLNTITLVGSINNWGNPDEAGKVQPDITLKGSRTTAYMEWKGTVTLTTSDEFKVRANGAWDFNWGGVTVAPGETKTLVFNSGDNIKVSEDGTYDVTVDFKAQPATITLVKK